MSTTRWMNRALAAAGLWALSTTGAFALTLQIVGGGMTATNLNYGCPTGAANCQTGSDFSLTSAANAAGSIVINDAGTLATITLEVGSVSFTPTGGGSPIVFGPVTYTGTASVFSTSSSITGLAPGAGVVTGNVNTTPFLVYPSIFNLNCAIPGGTGQCGLTFGRTGFTGVAGHDWVHTFNVTVSTVPVPEPATALLVAFGVAGLLLRSRRA
jgi:hypothetical protein